MSTKEEEQEKQSKQEKPSKGAESAPMAMGDDHGQENDESDGPGRQPHGNDAEDDGADERGGKAAING